MEGAEVGANRRDGGAVGEPVFAAANLFGAHTGEHEIDLRGDRGAVNLQQFVRGAVGRGRMRTHPKPPRNWFKAFFLFSDAATVPPPPRPLHKSAMTGIH